MIEGLEKLLAQGKESPELRFGLGNAYLGEGKPEQARKHLRVCLEQNPDYSAAWKLLGRACQALERPDEALDAYRQGIAAALKAGDLQAEKEMKVFVRRLQKQQQG